MDDPISRQAAIDALIDWEMNYDWDYHCREEDPKPAYIVSPSNVIEQLPSAQQERKRGRWTRPSRKNTYERFCSECGDKAWVCGKGDYRFCPNCGSDNRGGKDEAN